jgi:hypothetical protein
MVWFHMTLVKDHNSNQGIDCTFNRIEDEWLKPVCFLYKQLGTKNVSCDVRWSAILMRALGDCMFKMRLIW